MIEQKIMPLLLLVFVILPFQACGGIFGANEKDAQDKIEATTLMPTEVPAATEVPPRADIVAETEAITEPEVEAITELEVEETSEVEADLPAEAEVEESAEIAAPEPTPAKVEVEEAADIAPTEPNTPTPAPTDEPALTTTAQSIPFTATTGLKSFASYRMQFATEFEGTRQSQPTSGSLSGTLEATKKPEAQHWRVDMEGDAFSALAGLGTMELYDVNNTFYIQNPQDGSWLGVPAMLVDSMLPDGMYTPEESIDLPERAVLQPGQETINGLATQRHTFGPEDLAGDSSNYDQVEGTIWVAVDGNYVVKYEATISGQHKNLAAGGMELLDEGTITMMYEVSDVNSSFTIDPPEGARNIDLGSLLFN